MTRAKISEYSATANDNTDVNGINIAEGCPPSSMNNMGREIMAALKRFQVGSDGDGVTVGGSLVVSGSTSVNTFNVDVISEKTSAAGVTVDGVLLKDSGVVTGAGTVSAPVYSTTGDTNTGIFFPAADTIAFAEGGAEAMRINSSGNVGIGTTSPYGVTNYKVLTLDGTTGSGVMRRSNGTNALYTYSTATTSVVSEQRTLPLVLETDGTERMRITSSGNVGIGTTSPNARLNIASTGNGYRALFDDTTNDNTLGVYSDSTRIRHIAVNNARGSYKSYGVECNGIVFNATNGAESARITSGGDFCVGTTAAINVGKISIDAGAFANGLCMDIDAASGYTGISINRTASDGDLISFNQAGVGEGSISVSGNTVSYNAFSGGHWSQLQQGRGYNPDIPRGTVMSTIGEMCLWKSVEWTETTEHPAIPAVEAKEAVLDEEGNVIEPAVEAVEGKDAWTETIPHREAYLGQLPVGATFEEDGFTKTVVDDGNERLPKVKVSDVVGDKAVYGVFQTWDEVQDMLVTSLGAFVVRIAAGVTVEIGDLLESNGDGCAKVQDDDVIRSKTIAKVTSTTPTATYDDGSYTVPAVIYCG